MKILVNAHNLLCGIGSSGLLTVPEGRICNPDIIRHMMGNNTVIERNFGNFRIGKQVMEHIGSFYIHQGIHVFFQFQ
jgi:hypothetical protein